MRMLFARIEPYTFRPRWLSWLATQCLVGRYHAEDEHPVSRLLHRIDEQVQIHVDYFTSGLTPQQELERLTWAKASGRYPHGLPDNVREQLAHELRLASSRLQVLAAHDADTDTGTDSAQTDDQTGGEGDETDDLHDDSCVQGVRKNEKMSWNDRELSERHAPDPRTRGSAS